MHLNGKKSIQVNKSGAVVVVSTSNNPSKFTMQNIPIFVMQSGYICVQGRHEEFLSISPEYEAIYKAYTSKVVLDEVM